jgi:hypothetical protein
VEKNNAHQKEAYRKEFSDSMQSLQQGVLNYCEEEKVKSQECFQRLQDEIAKKNELVSRQREFFDDMLNRRQQLISKIIDTEQVKKLQLIRIYWK